MPTPKGGKAWNSGTSQGWSDKRGYRWIYVTENGRRRAKREHRHLVEQSLGRKLSPEEVVHHINGDKSDNRLENLEVKPFGLHSADHHRGSQHTEQAKITQSVIAEYREENKRLRLLNSDMLEALHQAREWLESWASAESQLAAINAAIAKAEGGAS